MLGVILYNLLIACPTLALVTGQPSLISAGIIVLSDWPRFPVSLLAFPRCTPSGRRVVHILIVAPLRPPARVSCPARAILSLGVVPTLPDGVIFSWWRLATMFIFPKPLLCSSLSIVTPGLGDVFFEVARSLRNGSEAMNREFDIPSSPVWLLSMVFGLGNILQPLILSDGDRGLKSISDLPPIPSVYAFRQLQVHVVDNFW